MSVRGGHADEALLLRYRDDACDPATAASVEAHLPTCEACRARLAGLGRAPVVDVAWGRVVAAIGTPEPSPAVRLLRRMGLSEADATLLRAARSLDGSWTIATIAVVAFAALAAIDGGSSGRALYLLVAPLLPVIGVVVAFSSSDSLAGLISATPYSKARLALLRTAAVCAASVPLVIAFGAAVPPIGWLAVGWLMPALALTTLTLAAMTWIRPATAGGAAGALWLLIVAAAFATDDVGAAVASGPALGYALVSAVAAACLTVRLKSAHEPGGPR